MGGGSVLINAPLSKMCARQCLCRSKVFVPEKPGAQGEEQMPKSLGCRTLADLKASELEEEQAYWNEYVDQMGPEQMHQDWLLDQLAEQMHQERKSSKKKKNLDRTVQVMERIPEHTVVSFDQE